MLDEVEVFLDGKRLVNTKRITMEQRDNNSRMLMFIETKEIEPEATITRSELKRILFKCQYNDFGRFREAVLNEVFDPAK